MILAFAAGCVTEFAWLAWVYCAAQGWPLRCALASMAIGGMSFYGVKVSLNSRWRAGAMILGYGVGSATAAYLKGM